MEGVDPSIAIQDPHSVSEDDRRRSDHIRGLVGRIEPDVTSTGNSDSAIPPLLIQFWNDSTSVPQDVRACMESWRVLESQGVTRLLFDDPTAERFITENFDQRHQTAFSRCSHPAMRSDYFRLCFILKHGGSYIDADDVYSGGDYMSLFADGMLKLQPLCYDARTDSMVAPSVFLDDLRDLPHLTYYVNNNPIVSPANHPIIAAALERSTRKLCNLGASAPDIQSVTGPGNLSASLVFHSLSLQEEGDPDDFILLASWSEISESRWPLEYRSDARNWRLWDGRHVS